MSAGRRGRDNAAPAHRDSPCSKKLIRPVAMTGFPIQMYQSIHALSRKLSEERSVPLYRSAP
jgi:hypothetical protein